MPSPLADWLAARLRQTSWLHLRLTADLPTAWQRFPYEWLTLDGGPLHHRLQVWRNVPLSAEPPAPVRHAPVALLNFWPDNERIQPFTGLAVAPFEVHRYDGRREVEALLRSQDVRTYSALCLIVHGSEQAHAPSFRLPDDMLWALPPISLPPLVILLACGDSNGNLIDYAATLLQRGALTVLAAIGKPDPRYVAVLYHFFIDLIIILASIHDRVLTMNMVQIMTRITETVDELKTIMHAQSKARLKERVHAFYLLKAGTVNDISDLASCLGRSESTVRLWFSRYQEKSLSGLLALNYHGGKRPALSEKILDALQFRLQEPEGFQSYGEIKDWLSCEYSTPIQLVEFLNTILIF